MADDTPVIPIRPVPVAPATEDEGARLARIRALTDEILRQLGPEDAFRLGVCLTTVMGRLTGHTLGQIAMHITSAFNDINIPPIPPPHKAG
jgi:hypothetical protein